VEILQLLEERNKDKDWLVEYIKKNQSEMSVRPNLTVAAILESCPSESLSRLVSVLKNGLAEVADASIGPVRSFHWFYTDIVASANPNMSTEEQARRIVVLTQLMANNEVFKNRDPDSLVLPTGDGMVIGFPESPEKPLLLAMEVSKGLIAYNKSKDDKKRVDIRVGLDSGPVFLLTDVNGQRTAWGQGLIMAKRIMDLGSEMHMLASDTFVNSLQRLRPKYQHLMHMAGYYEVKHGEKALVYNIYNEEFGNKMPIKRKQALESNEDLDAVITTNRFLFSSIEILLEIKDIETMLTHHTMIWDLINITKRPIERVFYSLEGDVQRSFADLNITVSDESGEKQDIMNIELDQELKKEFFVKLKRPINPSEKARRVTIEYDWEEKSRHYLYKFASKCENFRFQLTAPKPLDVRHRVVKVDLNTGGKFVDPNPATVQYQVDKTIMSWSRTGLTVFDTYRFDW